MPLLAVYGTLRYGQHNHSVLTDQNAAFVGMCWLPNWDMYDYGSFPFIASATGQQENMLPKVLVEIYKVPNLKGTDLLEGYPTFYNRTKIATPFDESWVYYMKDVDLSRYRKVVSGDWVAYREASTGKIMPRPLDLTGGVL